MRDELRGCKRSHPEHTIETSLMLIVHRSSTAEDLIDEDQVLIDAYLQKFCKKDFRTASDCLCQKLRKDAGIDSVLDPQRLEALIRRLDNEDDHYSDDDAWDQ